MGAKIGHIVSEETKEKLRKYRGEKNPNWKGGWKNKLPKCECGKTISYYSKRCNKCDGYNMRGEKNPSWKGDDIKYTAIHMWLYTNFGKAKKCELCGKNKRKYSWANLDHKYVRDIKYWKQLCYSCHKIYDLKNNTKK